MYMHSYTYYMINITWYIFIGGDEYEKNMMVYFCSDDCEGIFIYFSKPNQEWNEVAILYCWVIKRYVLCI